MDSCKPERASGLTERVLGTIPKLIVGAGATVPALPPVVTKPPVVGAGARCGALGKGAVCGGGNCCSSQGWCGKTDRYCGAGLCQSAYGTCYGKTVGAGSMCGALGNGAVCGGGACCSIKGYCGMTERYCGKGLCQAAFGKCS